MDDSRHRDCNFSKAFGSQWLCQHLVIFGSVIMMQQFCCLSFSFEILRIQTMSFKFNSVADISKLK